MNLRLEGSRLEGSEIRNTQFMSMIVVLGDFLLTLYWGGGRFSPPSFAPKPLEI